jgi:hypothetical protein
VTRRPASRRPPKLPDRAPQPVRREVKEPSPRERLKAAHVTGRSLRFGREEVVGVMRRLVAGDTRARLGLPPMNDLALEHVEAAVADVYGWRGDGPRARIAPRHTIDAFVAARDRIHDVAAAGGTLAFATGRPASMLSLYRAMATSATRAGGAVLQHGDSIVVSPGACRLWWIDGIAVATDRGSVLADQGVPAAQELFFALLRPDLVVADSTFAGVALELGLEVVAFADLDALALAVAAWRGLAVRVVPLDQQRPPGAYGPLVELLGHGPPADDDLGLADLPVMSDEVAVRGARHLPR